ncbi:uncharacterized protein [Procambarus clarkii]|uniref:uncharacterized protein n=1 Tax=Procambarus clarkii TaxID=6728 RepID=UPI001E671986|nr:uncharacterized protein LOC123746859 [Procambarus clarkii]
MSSEHWDLVESYDYLQEMATKSSSIRWPALLLLSTLVTIALAVAVFLWIALKPSPGSRRYPGNLEDRVQVLADKLTRSTWGRCTAREYRKRVWINWKKNITEADLNTITRLRFGNGGTPYQALYGRCRRIKLKLNRKYRTQSFSNI